MLRLGAGTLEHVVFCPCTDFGFPISNAALAELYGGWKPAARYQGPEIPVGYSCDLRGFERVNKIGQVDGHDGSVQKHEGPARN
jgi:hypothetical protein